VAEATPASAPRPSIRIQGAVKSFDGRVVVDVADLTLGRHPIEGLIGPNGAGKTTLMRMVMHSISLDRGRISFIAGDGSASEVVLSKRPAHAIARLGVVKTNQVIQDFEQLTIWDSLLLAAARARDERATRIYRERRVWSEYGEEIQGYLDVLPFDNPFGFAGSAGEKKQLDIIRCLLVRPKLLLLDEPTAGLPAGTRDRVMELIRKKATEENVSVVIVEHDLNVIWNLSDYVHFMAEGSVVLQGDPGWIREHETVVEKYLGKGHVGR
jgi:ABC-type branched-subunit amino acid transport system ATPase component